MRDGGKEETDSRKDREIGGKEGRNEVRREERR